MINLIKQIIESKNAEYLIHEIEESSYELFFVDDELQMNRTKDVHHFEVTVYHSHDNFKGSASFALHPTMNKEELEKAIDEGIYAASLVNNKTFNLAPKTDALCPKTENKLSKYSKEECARKIAEAIFSCDKKSGILNATEVFVYDRLVKLYNSNGACYDKHIIDAEIEYITTQKGEKEEVEIYNFLTIKDLDEKHIKSKVEEALETTKQRAIAKPMKSFDKIDVMFRKEELLELFGYYLSQTNLSSLYAKQSNRQIGENIQGSKITGDKLTITIDPLLESSSSIDPFDGSCYLNEKTVIIEDGVIKNLWGNRIHGQYLGIESKVNSNNIFVNTGSLDEKSLENKTYLDIIKMSGIQVDTTTGSFGGEIRLAIYHHDGICEALSGGSISGFIKDYSETMLLSNELIKENNYNGPKFMFIKDATILGK